MRIKEKTSKLLSLLLSFAMILSFVPTVVLATGGTWDGSGTADDPWQIADAADLYALATAESSYFDDYFVLTDNITLSDEWTPIGTSSSTFQGTFDGDGNTITGLTITDDTSLEYVGLFGYISSTATIEDIALEDVNIDTEYIGSGNFFRIGAVVGYNYGGTIDNVSVVSGSVTVNIDSSIEARVGGIAGDSTGTIRNAYNAAAISAYTGEYAMAGGIAGRSWGGTIYNCYNTGAIYADGSSEYVGGIVAYTNNTVTNVYTTGAVSCYQGSAEDISPVVGSGDTYVTNGYYLSGLESGCNLSKIVNSESFSDAETLLTNLNTWVSANNDDGYYLSWTIADDDTYPSFYVAEYWIDYATAPKDYNTGDTSITITSAEELAWVADQVNNESNTFEGVTITLANSIDLSGAEWTPIGTDGTNSFKGTFDGDGKTVSGLYINETVSQEYYAGLFGYVYGGTVKNVNVSGSVSANTETQNNYVYVGGVVGMNYGGTVESCSSAVTVYGGAEGQHAYVGGVVGKSSNSAIVRNCYATGTVSGTVTSSTTKSAYAGGVVGHNMAYLENCYATGAVTATSTNNAYAGGVVGYHSSNDVLNCYATGEVSATGGDGKTVNAGGVAGNKGSATVSDCYWTSGATYGIGTSSDDGCTKITEADTLLTKLNTWVNTKASTDYRTWKIDGTNDGYPVLSDYYAPYEAVNSTTGVSYETLETAISSAVSGNSITLMADVEIESTIEIEDKNLTLDLNGYDIHHVNGNSSVFKLSGTVQWQYYALTLKDSDGANKGTRYITGTGSSAVISDTDNGGIAVTGGVIYGGFNHMNGGGIFVDGGAKLIMTGGTIAGNNTTYNGGGVYSGQYTNSFTMSGGTITGNKAGYGGGVYTYNITTTVSGGTISNNVAVTDGGGVYATNFTMTGGSITENTATRNGDSVYFTSTMNVKNAITIDAGDVDGDGVYLNSKTINVTGSVSGASIAVSASAGDTITQGSSYTLTDNDYAAFSVTPIDDEKTLVFDTENNNVVYTDYLVKVATSSDTQYFTTITDAITYANTQTGDITVTLLDDCTSDATLTILKAMTLDLNGYDIEYIGGGTASVITVNAALTLNDSDPNSRMRYGYWSDETYIITDDATAPTVAEDTVVDTLTGGIIRGGDATKGGGIYIYDDFTMNGGTIAGNTATSGGGIYIDDAGQNAWYLKGGTIAGNTATNGGGIYHYEDECFIDGTATITNNKATYGGGIYVACGVYFTSGTISNNTATHGGGIYVNYYCTISGGTITGNTATGNGDSVYVNDPFKVSGDLIIDQGDSGNGDGVYLPSGKTMTVNGELTTGASIYFTSADTTSLENFGDSVTFATSTTDYSDSMAGVFSTSVGDGMTATLVTTVDEETYTYSLVAINEHHCDETCACYGGTVIHDYDGLVTAASTGGTYYLGADIDASATVTVSVSDFSLCLNGHTIDANQGAYSVFTISAGATFNLYDYAGSTRETVIDDPTSSTGGTFTVTGGLITDSKAENGGAVNVMYATYDVDGGIFNMYGGTLAGHDTSSEGGAVYVGESNGSYAGGTFNMYGGSIVCNDTGDGTIYIQSGATFNMTGGVISNNSDTAVYNNGTFTMSGGTIEENTVGVGAGVFVNGGTFTMSDNALIQNNTASSGSGGGVYVSSGTFTMNGGTITGNTANGNFAYGNGVYVYQGTLELSGSPVIDGVYVNTNGTITVTADLDETARIGLEHEAGDTVGTVDGSYDVTNYNFYVVGYDDIAEEGYTDGAEITDVIVNTDGTIRIADFIYKTDVDIVALNGIDTITGIWFEALTTTTSLVEIGDTPDKEDTDFNEKYVGFYILEDAYTSALTIGDSIYIHLNGKEFSGATTLGDVGLTVFDDGNGSITGVITMTTSELLLLGGEISSLVSAMDEDSVLFVAGAFTGTLDSKTMLVVAYDGQLGTETTPFTHNSANPIYYASTSFPLESGAKFYINLSSASSGDILAIDMEETPATSETFTSYCTLSGGAFVTSYDSASGEITLDGVDVDSASNIIYANGLALVITDGATDGYSSVFWDANGDGSYDADDGDIYVKENTDLSTWIIYGGSKDANVVSSSITIAGGLVKNIYTGGHNSDSVGDDGLVTAAQLTISGDATEMAIHTTATETNLTVQSGGKITIDSSDAYKLVSNAGTINWDGGTIETLVVDTSSTTNLSFAPSATKVQFVGADTLTEATKFITLVTGGDYNSNTFGLVDSNNNPISNIIVQSGSDLYFAPALSATIAWTDTAQYDSKTTATVTLSNMDLGDSAVFVEKATIYAVGTSGDVKVGEITVTNGTTVYETVAIDLTDGNISVDSSLNVKLYVVFTLETDVSTSASTKMSSETLALSKNTASFTVTGTEQVYNGADKAVTITGTGSSLEASDFTITYYLITNGNVSNTATTPVDAGSYQYVISFADNANVDTVLYDVGTYNTGTLTIGQSATDFGDEELDVDDLDSTYTYGETMTITVTPEATGISPLALYDTEPTAGQMALYATIGGVVTQLCAPVSAESDGSYELTYDTTDKLLTVGTHEITAKFVANDNMATYSETFTIKIVAKTIDDVTVDTTDTSYDFSKDYTGSVQDFEDIPLSSTDVETGDTVSLTVDYTTTAADADTYTVSGTVVLGTNDDEGFYVLADNEDIVFTGTVTIDAVAPIFDGITASAGNGSVTVTWEVDDGCSAITAYELSATYLLDDVVTNVEGAPFSITDLDATSYTVTGLTNGTEYTFVLKATNGEGYTSSAELTATPYKSSSSGGSSVTYYNSTLEETVSGEASLSATSAVIGKTITITISPDEGYAVASVTVVKSDGDAVSITDNGDGTYSYLQPASDATVTVSFVAVDEEDSDDSFTDVDEDDWYFDAVEWAVDTGITNGTSSTKFSPDMICTRAQAVTFIWKSYGSPEVDYENPFVDVAEDSYYYEAVLWAVSEGITIGTSDTTFSPDVDCTRGHIVTFLHRAAGEPLTDSENLFTDLGENAYYYSAVLWAISEEITNGTSNDAFSPNKDCTRSEIVTFLYRYFAI